MHILIIGAGSAGERHLRNFLRIPGVRCSVTERNVQKLQKIAAEYDVVETYTDYRDTKLDSFDGVVVSVPTDQHIRVGMDVLNANTHILLEKPLSMTLEGVDELKQLHAKIKKTLMVGFSLRSDPLFMELRERVMRGEAGTIKLADYYVGQYWPRMRKDYPPQYAQSRATGGGAIPDHLIHMINFLEWCFGLPEEISAQHWRLGLTEIATEDTASVVIKFKCGVVAFLGICLFQQDSNMRLQLIGSQTSIRLSTESETLEIYNPDDGMWLKGLTKRQERDLVFLNQAQHFIDCIQGKATPRCTLQEAEQTLRTMLAALQSGDADGRFVKVDSEQFS